AAGPGGPAGRGRPGLRVPGLAGHGVVRLGHRAGRHGRQAGVLTTKVRPDQAVRQRAGSRQRARSPGRGGPSCADGGQPTETFTVAWDGACRLVPGYFADHVPEPLAVTFVE